VMKQGSLKLGLPLILHINNGVLLNFAVILETDKKGISCLCLSAAALLKHVFIQKIRYAKQPLAPCFPESDES
jgi:hypothetical protein